MSNVKGQTSNKTGLNLLIANSLSGAWRESPPAPELSLQELNTIAPLLIGSGGGALLFWKIRGTDLESTDIGKDLKQTFRLYKLHSAIHELEIQKVIGLLAMGGVEPILVKGWSMARLYPDPALRPYGDIDLFVRPEQFGTAEDVLAGEEGRKFFVDLHNGSGHLCDQPFEDLWERSVTVTPSSVTPFRVTPFRVTPFRVTPLGVNTDADADASNTADERTAQTFTPQGVTLNETLKVRVLSHEDHLRILCVHFLHHGAWRPAGLCDIALLVEKFGSTLDWETCLTKNRRRARWVECTIGLAHKLLGANISSTPWASTGIDLPKWFVPSVLNEWENPISIDHVVPPPLAKKLSHPVETVKAIRRRWPPNPIQATIVMNAPFNGLPRIIFQTGDFLERSFRFLRRT